MKYSLKNNGDDEMVYATLRMTQKEFKDLYNYMHCKGEQILFPYGAHVTVRGRGWYRIVKDSAYRASDAINFAIKAIRRFLKEEEEKVEEALRLLMPAVLSNTQLSAYSNFHSAADLTYLGVERKTPSMHKLQALVSKFTH